MSHVSLLQDALTRASLRSDSDPKSPIRRSQRGRPRKATSPNQADDVGGTSESEDEDALVGVQTPVTVPGTPASHSRSTSPTRSGSRLAARRKERDLEAATSLDPLKRLPNELSSRIFNDLNVVDLLICGRVCKHWRRSATINYAWYLTFERDNGITRLPTAKPTWTRKESKQDWAARYKSIHRRDDLEISSAADADFERARSDGYRTPKEEREDRWQEESAEIDNPGADKVAARAYYKSLKNAKVKGKVGRAAGRDRSSAWDEE